MIATEPYQYRPLTESDGIRPFELQPAPARNATATGFLLHTTLKDCCAAVIDHFMALSYVWGDASDGATILVDGKPLSVTKTLEMALRHLRDFRRVWADAICKLDNGRKLRGFTRNRCVCCMEELCGVCDAMIGCFTAI
jgi:hypothetical protein